MASIVSLLASLPEPIVQILSDELQGAMRQSTVDNPLGYLRNLIEQYKAGTLVLEHAPRIQAERKQRQSYESAMPRATQPVFTGKPSSLRKTSIPPNWRAGLNLPEESVEN
jgi:hypothetical protein